MADYGATRHVKVDSAAKSGTQAKRSGTDKAAEEGTRLVVDLDEGGHQAAHEGLEETAAVPVSQQTFLQHLTLIKGLPATTKFRDNLKAGVTVALVNIPLGISLSLAGGGTPAQGIITTFWGGLVAGIFGSSHYNIVGTTGALSGLLTEISHSKGPSVLPSVSVLTGLILLVLTLVRFDKLLKYVNTPVAEGFSVAVAVIIACGQIPSAFGLSGLLPRVDFMGKLMMSLSRLGTTRVADMALCLVSFVALFQLSKWRPTIPWVVIIATVGIILGAFAPLGTFILLETKYPSIPATLFQPSFNASAVYADVTEHPKVLERAVAVAIVALLETLISAEIGNRRAHESTPVDTRRESFGMTLANLVSGLVGGIPCTAALARTSMNIRAGAFSRVSVIICSVFVGIISMFVMPYFAVIPMATIAAALLMVSWRLVNFEELGKIFATDVSGTYTFLLTMASCLMLDTFYGLIVGTVVSLVVNWKLGKSVVIQRSTSNPDVITVHSAAVNFLNAREHATILRQHLREVLAANPKSVTIVFGPMCTLDVDGGQAISDVVAAAYNQYGARDVRVQCADLFFDALRHYESFHGWTQPGSVPCRQSV